MSLQPTVWSYK